MKKILKALLKGMLFLLGVMVFCNGLLKIVLRNKQIGIIQQEQGGATAIFIADKQK